MNKCEDILELISAHVDGEISEADLAVMQAHLSACENCSAILELYKEMSVAVAETCVSVPESLKSGVMDRILSEKKDERADSADVVEPIYSNVDKKKNSPITYLKRYLPAIACLAVILVALPWVITNQGRQADYTAAPAAAVPGAAAPGAVARNETTQVFADAGGVSEMEVSPADEAAVDMPAMAGGASPSAHDSVTASRYGQAQREISDVDPTAPPAPSRAPEQWVTMEDTEEDAEEDTEEEPPAAEEAVPPESLWADIEELRAFDLLISEAYVLIEIHGGELPVILHEFEPEPVDGWSIWDSLFKIPREVALTLITEIQNREGARVTFAYSGQDSSYAVVFYTSGG